MTFGGIHWPAAAALPPARSVSSSRRVNGCAAACPPHRLSRPRGSLRSSCRSWLAAHTHRRHPIHAHNHHSKFDRASSPWIRRQAGLHIGAGFPSLNINSYCCWVRRVETLEKIRCRVLLPAGCGVGWESALRLLRDGWTAESKVVGSAEMSAKPLVPAHAEASSVAFLPHALRSAVTVCPSVTRVLV